MGSPIGLSCIRTVHGTSWVVRETDADLDSPYSPLLDQPHMIRATQHVMFISGFLEYYCGTRLPSLLSSDI